MRVSTKGHGQTTDTQAVALREYAERRGFEIVEYRDEGISGSKDSRPALDRLMRDARARKFDVVIVARFDRFARSGRLSRKLCFEPWSFSSLKPRLEHGIELRQDGDDAVIRDAPFSVFE